MKDKNCGNVSNKGIETLFAAKKEFHKERAKLPFEEKIRYSGTIAGNSRGNLVKEKKPGVSQACMENMN